MADHYFDRWFAEHADEQGSPGRKATVDDCRYACNNASSLHHAWCVSFVFEPAGYPNPKDAASTCKLYDDCSQPATKEDEKLRAFDAAGPESAAAAVADPAIHGDGKCLRVEDTAFDRWFVGRTPSRKASEADAAAPAGQARVPLRG